MSISKKENDVDLSEMRETLGQIMASFTYIYDPYAIIKEIDIIMSFESAMLDFRHEWGVERWGPIGIEVDIPVRIRSPGYSLITANHGEPHEKNKVRVKSYRELFKILRFWWEAAVNNWNSQTGNWKESIIICSRLRSDLMRIALKEGLVSLRTNMYSISAREPLPQPSDEFFEPSQI
jgi:hypothetical protein